MTKAMPQVYSGEHGLADPGTMMDQTMHPERMMYNPLSPYNPIHMNRLLQMQNQQAASEQQIKEEELPSLSEIFKRRMEFAISISSQQIINNDIPINIVALSPVESEKVKFMKALMFTLEKEGKITKSFKMVGEKYNKDEDEDDNVQDPNFFLADPVRHISEIVEQLQNNDFEVVFIKDITNLGTKDEITNFMKIAQEKKVSIISSANLNNLDGTLPDQLPTIIDNSSIAFNFEGIDIFDENQIATHNYVGVPISLKGEVINSKNETFYSAMPQYERELLVKKFLALPQSNKLITKRRIENPKGDDEIIDVIMLPMNKFDLNDNGDFNNIIAVSQTTSDKLYKLAQAEPPARLSVYFPKILNWQEMGM
jgi:hypothetical protein